MRTASPSIAAPPWIAAWPRLRDADDYAWRHAVSTAKVMTIPAGTIVIRPGDPCDNFLLVDQGTIRVCQRTQDGRAITLHRTGAGEICIFTLQALLENIDYDVELISEDDVRVVSIPQQDFYRCMAESEAFRRFIVNLLTRRLCDLTRLVQQVTFQGLGERMACLLGQLFKQRNTTRLEMTHLELASEVGSSREVVSRMLKEFEQKGCLRLHRGSIELVLPELLARLANPGKR
jgi:CRP/FNR family transcriptional regulator, anaerobic regulatory protein